MLQNPVLAKMDELHTAMILFRASVADTWRARLKVRCCNAGCAAARVVPYAATLVFVAGVAARDRSALS